MLSIGIYGFGRFGRFLAKSLENSAFKIYATSRTDYSQTTHDLHGALFTHDLCDFFHNKLDILIISTSILSFTESLNLLAPHLQKLEYPILLIDVCSVKEYPKKQLLQCFPSASSVAVTSVAGDVATDAAATAATAAVTKKPTISILCTHPMFGPDSASNSYQGLYFMFEKVRIHNPLTCQVFLDHYQKLGCTMVEMSCEQHDTYTSSSQFITHLTGRVLSNLKLTSTPINTTGYEMLLGLVENTENDSLELFRGLFRYNSSAKKNLLNFQKSLENIIQELDS